VSEVYDLDALAAEAEPFRFRFGGEDYEMPADIDLTSVAKLDRGDAEGALQAILGAEQWQRMVDSPATFGIKQLMGLLDKYAEHLGMPSLGGFLASTGSSPNTAQQ
jgi:hypothetical protein